MRTAEEQIYTIEAWQDLAGKRLKGLCSCKEELRALRTYVKTLEDQLAKLVVNKDRNE